MYVVYLDQNKWIDLARAFHGKTVDLDLKSALDFVQRLAGQGTVAFPLSSVHYMETAKSKNHERRKRLGEAMWEVSGGRTIASHRQIMRFEVESALAKRFSDVTPRDFRLVSQGAAHAFDGHFAYQIPDELRQRMPGELAEELESELQDVLEKAAITGEGPDGIRMPSQNISQPNEGFKEHLKTLPQRVSSLSLSERENFLHFIALDDIKKPINEALDFHGLSWDRDVLPLESEGLTSLVQDMPSRKTEIHLHRQIIKNPNLKPKDNDLDDWSALGPATAHCDVVVCEKHFANLLQRDGFQPNAQVITNVRNLPTVLQTTFSL